MSRHRSRLGASAAAVAVLAILLIGLVFGGISTIYTSLSSSKLDEARRLSQSVALSAQDLRIYIWMDEGTGEAIVSIINFWAKESGIRFYAVADRYGRIFEQGAIDIRLEPLSRADIPATAFGLPASFEEVAELGATIYLYTDEGNSFGSTYGKPESVLLPGREITATATVGNATTITTYEGTVTETFTLEEPMVAWPAKLVVERRFWKDGELVKREIEDPMIYMGQLVQILNPFTVKIGNDVYALKLARAREGGLNHTYFYDEAKGALDLALSNGTKQGWSYIARAKAKASVLLVPEEGYYVELVKLYLLVDSGWRTWESGYCNVGTLKDECSEAVLSLSHPGGSSEVRLDYAGYSLEGEPWRWGIRIFFDGPRLEATGTGDGSAIDATLSYSPLDWANLRGLWARLKWANTSAQPESKTSVKYCDDWTERRRNYWGIYVRGTCTLEDHFVINEPHRVVEIGAHVGSPMKVGSNITISTPWGSLTCIKEGEDAITCTKAIDGELVWSGNYSVYMYLESDGHYIGGRRKDDRARAWIVYEVHQTEEVDVRLPPPEGLLSLEVFHFEEPSLGSALTSLEKTFSLNPGSSESLSIEINEKYAGYEASSTAELWAEITLPNDPEEYTIESVTPSDHSLIGPGESASEWLRLASDPGPYAPGESVRIELEGRGLSILGSGGGSISASLSIPEEVAVEIDRTYTTTVTTTATVTETRSRQEGLSCSTSWVLNFRCERSISISLDKPFRIVGLSVSASSLVTNGYVRAELSTPYASVSCSARGYYPSCSNSKSVSMDWLEPGTRFEAILRAEGVYASASGSIDIEYLVTRLVERELEEVVVERVTLTLDLLDGRLVLRATPLLAVSSGPILRFRADAQLVHVVVDYEYQYTIQAVNREAPTGATRSPPVCEVTVTMTTETVGVRTRYYGYAVFSELVVIPRQVAAGAPIC